MKALVCHGPYDIRVDDKPKPQIKDPEDIVLKVTTTAICGSDLNRAIQVRMGQCPVKSYNEDLLHLIEVGRIDPTPIISHVMKLSEGPKAYEMFDKKDGSPRSS